MNVELLVACSLPVLWAGCMVAAARTRVADAAGALGSIVTFALATRILVLVSGSGPMAEAIGHLRADALSAGALELTSLMFVMACLYAGPYMAAEERLGHLPANWRSIFWPLIFMFYSAMVWICLSDNLGLVWVAMELTTLVTVPLVCITRDKRGLEAAWKYFVLCSVGIAFALIGTIFLYASTLRLGAAGPQSLDWSKIVAHARQLDPEFIRLAFIFALAGYGCKMGLVPMHNWLPDAHSEAPTPVSALLSGVLLNCACYAMLRFYVVAELTLRLDHLSPILLCLGLASVIVPAFFIVVQTDLKRMLAYSSIEHMGIVAIGLGLGGDGVYAALLHAINHSVAKALLFMAAGQVLLCYRTKQLARIQGVLATGRATGLALGAGSLAIVGLPPFAPFLSEFLIVRAAFLTGRFVTGILLVSAMTLTFAGFLSHLVPALCGDAQRGVEPLVESPRATFVMACLIVISLGIGLQIPAPLDRTLHACVSIIRGG